MEEMKDIIEVLNLMDGSPYISIHLLENLLTYDLPHLYTTKREGSPSGTKVDQKMEHE